MPRGAPRGHYPPPTQRNTLQPQADQHARRLARHGIYPHLRLPLDVRGLDLIEEARASLAVATHAWSGAAAARHGHRAAQLAEQVGIEVPDLLVPAWQALLDEPAAIAPALT
jgi:hypothetical protein